MNSQAYISAYTWLEAVLTPQLNSYIHGHVYVVRNIKDGYGLTQFHYHESFYGVLN